LQLFLDNFLILADKSSTENTSLSVASSSLKAGIAKPEDAGVASNCSVNKFPHQLIRRNKRTVALVVLYLARVAYQMLVKGNLVIWVELDHPNLFLH
jgi:hypothetical protein